MKTQYLGLWKQRDAWYKSQTIKKSDIQSLGNNIRIILRYNKFKEKEDNKPHFVFYFADSDTSEAITLETEKYSDTQDHIDELKELIEQIRYESITGQESSGNFDGAYYSLDRIENLCDKIISGMED